MDNTLKDLKKFMLLNNNFCDTLTQSPSPSPIKCQIKKKETIYSFFWCLYMMNNGFNNSNQNKTVIETQEKYKMIEYCNANKDKLTNPVWGGKFSRAEIERSIQDSKYSLKLFIILCNIYNLPIIFLFQGNKYYLNTLDKPKHIIQCNGDNEVCHIYYLNNKDKENYLENIYKTWVKIETLYYKIKAITGYKKEDLVEICNNNGINVEKKNKQELYELIVKYYSDKSIFSK
jgi:hypothetical protein